MSSENKEGLDTFQRVTVSNGVPVEGRVVWIIDETVPIIDGRIRFYSRDFDAIFDVPVKQVRQGFGTADADGLTNLSPTHMLILKLVVEKGEGSYTAKDMKDMVIANSDDKLDPNHYNRPISELLRKKCFTLEGKIYHLNKHVIDQCMETGKFQ